MANKPTKSQEAPKNLGSPSLQLFSDKESQELHGKVSSSKRKGPPNRMNDLPYREWMKFQKSFYRFKGWNALVLESIAFFTKEIWPDGRRSDVLLIGFPAPESKEILGQRSISVIGTRNLNKILHETSSIAASGRTFDFVLVDFRELDSANGLSVFLNRADEWYASLRKLLNPGRYVGVVVDWPSTPSFPIPWAVALAGRSHLRLRDEKIGLEEGVSRCHYCLFFQEDNDALEGLLWFPEKVQISKSTNRVAPLWTMPKSPPRTADEVYHPAKFPERLVRQFIEIFTSPGDTILDPMMGTGSVLVAAVHTDRKAIGIDINPTYAQIAEQKVQDAFPRLLKSDSGTELVTGDARQVESLLGQKKVDYCITSPPYWSMLSNVGSEGQRARREKKLPTVYSDIGEDLANIESYEDFLASLEAIYTRVATVMKPNKYDLTEVLYQAH